MALAAAAPSRNGHGPRLDLASYRAAVKARMKKYDPVTGTRIAPTQAEVDQFLLECQLYKLEPLTGQIYAHWDNGVLRAVTTIDGLRTLADRTGRYDSQTDPEWCDRQGNWTDYWNGDEEPVAARVRVYKKGAAGPTTGTANWADFAPTGNVGAEALWMLGEGKPAHMLSIRCEAVALRKAFPAEMSGLYTVEELDLSLAVIGGEGDAVPSTPASFDSPAVAPPPPVALSDAEAAAVEDRPAVIVDAAATQPSGPPAPPRSKRTLEEALAAGEYRKLRGELAAALFDQLPDRLTEEQAGAMAALLRDADAAGITPYELEHLCKVSLREPRRDVAVRFDAIHEWIAERQRKCDGDDVDAAQGPGAPQDRSAQAGPGSDVPGSLFEVDRAAEPPQEGR